GDEFSEDYIKTEFCKNSNMWTLKRFLLFDLIIPCVPFSAWRILQLWKSATVLGATGTSLELEQESAVGHCDQSDESERDNGRRRAKSVEACCTRQLQKELWAGESGVGAEDPTAEPNWGLVVAVLDQEEQVDRDHLSSQTEVWVSASGPRPRRLRQRWAEAVGDMADAALPLNTQFSPGFLDRFLGQIRTRYQPFQVYVQSYHTAVTKRLSAITERPLETTDVYSLLDWAYNVYYRDVLDPLGGSELPPLLSPDTVERLELDCLNSVRAKVTTELAQVLEDEENRWMETLHIEEYSLTLSSSVIQRLEKDLERSASVSKSLGARVAHCSLNGLADFYYSLTLSVFRDFSRGLDGFSLTLSVFREFALHCAQSDPTQSEDSLRRASRALDAVVQRGVRPLFERLVKRKWLNNTEPLDQIQTVIRENFKKYQRMDPPPYQVLVGEVHRRVVTEYLRSLMRGRLICTSAKMRRRAAQRLRDESAAIKGADSPSLWLDGALSHLSEIIDLEDLPSIQMEVGVLLREYPDVRRKHLSAVLNLRGLTRQSDRAEILDVLKDLEQSWESNPPPRDRALFAEVPVTSELHCVNVGLSRLALSASSCFTTLRPARSGGPRHRRESEEEVL
uniref:Exocyst complex component 3-like 2b n=1 Tax=Neogobius melanostomus TaxID=47308 RepID=A0A8C6SEI3_9GOBI